LALDVSHVRGSKHELRRVRDDLARYQRYLPTLRLKQQQLQVELRRIERELQQLEEREAHLRHGLEAWVALWAEEPVLAPHLKLVALRYGEMSVAGLPLPTLEAVEWSRSPVPLATTPAWFDEALMALEELLALRLERRVIAEQRARLAAELRLTSQRVNLFEKVKIPEAQEGLRVIRIALGDLQAAEVVRAKIAKRKSAEREVST
jgi:V/A-type H+-transporting ATPase subunit D